MELLEAGKIINTHGIRGEVKIENYCDNEEFFKKIKVLYIEGNAVNIISQRPHAGFILAMLEGVDSVEKAMTFKNKVVYFDRLAVKLPEGHFYISDILGFSVFDERTNQVLGTLKRCEEMPVYQMYVVDMNGYELLIPDVPDFVRSIDFTSKTLVVSTIEGMLKDEN